ncbi:hypothetical protein PENTCL1PPCAC_13963, partial [Pristionchus entomophagus]
VIPVASIYGRGNPLRIFLVIMLRSIAFALLVLSTAEAIVDFNDSAIVDQSDFISRSSVPVNGFCRDLCHIYASIAPEHRDIADKLLIQTPKGFVSVAELAYLKDAKTGRKLPLEVKNTPTLWIMNTNANLISGNVVLYVVNHNGGYFDSAEVYEAAELDRKPSFARAITILSARPFTLRESNYMAMGVIAKLAGFDTLDPLTCPTVYSMASSPFPGFTLAINGPIVSLLYDLNSYKNPAGALKAEIGFTGEHQMEQSGFVASAGWHGCAGREAYQSSYYNQTMGNPQRLYDSTVQDISLNVETNTNEADALILTSSNGTELARFHDNDKDGKSVVQFKDSRLDFTWTPQINTHYLVRYNSTAKPVY